jgi:hypothetical protein
MEGATGSRVGTKGSRFGFDGVLVVDSGEMVPRFPSLGVPNRLVPRAPSVVAAFGVVFTSTLSSSIRPKVPNGDPAGVENLTGRSSYVKDP